MTTYKRGDVVLLPFPYTDQSGSKRRPALILSTTDYNSRRGDLIVAPITSNLSTGQAEDTILRDWKLAGLLKPSVVKGVLGTIENTLVIRVMGTVTQSDLQEVEQVFARILDINIKNLSSIKGTSNP